MVVVTRALLAVLAPAQVAFGHVHPRSASPAVAVQPTLNWMPRSDWRNVKTGCNGTAGAAGDGQQDDTAAIQACLNNMTNGDTLYLPPGTYKITSTLVLGCRNVTEIDPKTHNPANEVTGCMIGGNIKGHGAATTVVWAGPTCTTAGEDCKNATSCVETCPGSVMLTDAGATSFRYMGVHWDGGGTAGVGIAHQSIKLFETEVVHEADAYTGFVIAAIGNDLQQLSASGHVQGATAEVYYRNCLFDSNGVGVAWSNFNALDNAIDGSLFRNNLFGLYGREGTAYVTNSRFENSTAADMAFVGAGWNHNTVRNVVSVGSNQFLQGGVSVSIFDCHVYGWVGSPYTGDFYWGDPPGPHHEPGPDALDGGAAIFYNGQIQIHDSTFHNPTCNKTASAMLGRDNTSLYGVICCVLDSGVGHYNTNPVLLVNSSLHQQADSEYPHAEWTCKHKFPGNGFVTPWCAQCQPIPSLGLEQRTPHSLNCYYSTHIANANRYDHGSQYLIYLDKEISGEAKPLGPTGPIATCEGPGHDCPNENQTLCNLTCNASTIETGYGHCVRCPSTTVLDLPDSGCDSTGIGIDTNFFKEWWSIPSKVIEVSQFGPFPSNNKSLDATDAIQQTIDAAAAAGQGAVAYFPAGTYWISKPLQVKGKDYWISGANALATMFKWGPQPPEVSDSGMINVAAGAQVVLEEISLSTLNDTVRANLPIGNLPIG